MNVKRFDSKEGNVWKYVFHFNGVVAEAVLYRYGSFKERTVICVSVSSGCQVGCTFCGTGNKFIRNLTSAEIIAQVGHILQDQKIYAASCNKFQIMFMSMGEPFLNYGSVYSAIHLLNSDYKNADLLVSTVAPNKLKIAGSDFIQLSKRIYRIGLQLSIHASNDYDRNNLIPYKKKLTLRELRDYGTQWWYETGRKPYLNYCITENFSSYNIHQLKQLFSPTVFCFTFSVLCSTDETMKDAGYHYLPRIREVEKIFAEDGYDTRVFDPAGQDDIGGGCGMLWYVQKHLAGKQ